MTRLFLFLCLLISSSVQASLVYEMTNGILTKITEVDVNGVLYDVTFRNGSFNNIYGNASNLVFTNSSDAIAASNTLLSLMGDNVVGSDGLIYDFEHGNWLVNGCNNYVYCDMLTTYGVSTTASGNEIAHSVYARNFNDLYASPGTDSDFVMSTGLLTNYDTSTTPWYTYSIWTESATVPEPSILSLLGIGLLGFAFAKRKAK